MFKETLGKLLEICNQQLDRGATTDEVQGALFVCKQKMEVVAVVEAQNELVTQAWKQTKEQYGQKEINNNEINTKD